MPMSMQDSVAAASIAQAVSAPCRHPRRQASREALLSLIARESPGGPTVQSRPLQVSYSMSLPPGLPPPMPPTPHLLRTRGLPSSTRLRVPLRSAPRRARPPRCVSAPCVGPHRHMLEGSGTLEEGSRVGHVGLLRRRNMEHRTRHAMDSWKVLLTADASSCHGAGMQEWIWGLC